MAIAVAPPAFAQSADATAVCPADTAPKLTAIGTEVVGKEAFFSIVNYQTSQACTGIAYNGAALSCQPLTSLPVALRNQMRERDCPGYTGG